MVLIVFRNNFGTRNVTRIKQYCLEYIRSYAVNSQPFTVLFVTGSVHFDSAYKYTKDILSKSVPNIDVKRCETVDLINNLENANVIIPFMSPITKEIIQSSKNLKLIIQFGVGLEGVDIEAATNHGIYVAKIESHSNGNAIACAEHAIYLSIGNIGKELFQRLLPFLPKEIFIIHKNSSNSIYNDIPTLIRSESGGIIKVHHGTHNDKFIDFAKYTDIVYLCCSQNKDNIGLVNHSFLSYLKRKCVIVNIARGGLLDYNDVLDCLNSGLNISKLDHNICLKLNTFNKNLGQVAGVGTDVYCVEPFPALPFLTSPEPLSSETSSMCLESLSSSAEYPESQKSINVTSQTILTTSNKNSSSSMSQNRYLFLSHPNVVCTPHVAGVTEISYRNMAKILSDNVLKVMNHKKPLGVVNDISFKS